MPQSPKTKSLTIPPPVKGWNARDPISMMDPQYAVAIENYFPSSGTVDLRKGYQQWATDVGSDIVYTLMPYETSTSYLLALGDDGNVYNVTSTGAGTVISGSAVYSGVTGLYSHQFNDVVFFTPIDGSVDPYSWSGSGNIASAAFTGIPGIKFLTIGSYKGRIYFAQNALPSIYYGALEAVTGALTEFDLGPVISRGFYFVFVGSITRNKQYAEDDLFCAITNAGEVLLYQGDNPEASTWNLLARYFIPAPILPKPTFYLGSSLYIMTEQGIISLKDLMSGASDVFPSLSQIIDPVLSPSLIYSSSSSVAYIRGVVYPKGNYLLINFLDSDSGSDTFQAVMNLQTGAWALFKGQQAYDWAVVGSSLYFAGTNGQVFKADTGYYDVDPAVEGVILPRSTKLRFAFNYLDDPLTVKTITQIRPIIYESEGLSLTIDADVDYDDVTATSTVTDSTDATYKIYKPTCGVRAEPGKAVSVRLDGDVTTKRRSLQAVEVYWKEGDIRP